MNKLYYLLVILLTSPLLVKAQSNYVATTPNSVNPPGGVNTLVGPSAGNLTLTGILNTFLGAYAGEGNTSGYENAYIGADAGGNNTTGYQNAYIGNYAGFTNLTGYQNAFLGYQAGFNCRTSTNVYIGYNAAYDNLNGSGNAFVGTQAGYNSNGSGNVFIGTNAGYNSFADFNSFVGNEAGYSNTSGINNAFLGYRTGYANTTGSSNTFLGWRSGRVNTTGSSNTFVGSEAGVASTTGVGNTFVGQQAGYNVTTGNHNIIIGPKSGTAVTTSDDNVLIGYNSQADDGLYNATAIGSGTRVAISNALILGNQANVGIGTSAPMARLEVVSESPDASGLRLTNLTSQSKSTQVADQFLTVNEKGDVVKARYQLRISNASEWSDNVFVPGYQLRPLASVAAYIGQHGHLPGVPSAAQVVKAGVDLVKMNATLLEKVEELTLYSIQQEKIIQHESEELQAIKREQTQLKQMLQQLLNQK